MANPFHQLTYEPAIATLGADYYDVVTAAEFPQHLLRFRNDRAFAQLGLDPTQVDDADVITAFGQFQGTQPFLALRYHGYQFGAYNPDLGDGRGFLYGQVRSPDGELYDLGTKGSGQTPYSRMADGRLTLKGGVREVLAAEALHQLGVKTSRCFCLIETGESLWRGDEPSPTRSSVMVRLSRSHIRFGTFERLHYLQRPDLIEKLLDHVITIYYSHLADKPKEDRKNVFYLELVERVAHLAAQWMAAGFCHGVLNTDNMSITGESFDYGPYAFVPTFNPRFIAAYFDYAGRYSFGNQPGICKMNLNLLQIPLGMVMDRQALEASLDLFDDYYFAAYRQLLLKRLGITEALPPELGHDLVRATVQLMADTQVGFGRFFATLAAEFHPNWRTDANKIFPTPDCFGEEAGEWSEGVGDTFRHLYHLALQEFPANAMSEIQAQLNSVNPRTTLVRPVIESIWEPITTEDNWQPFNDLLAKIWAKE